MLRCAEKSECSQWHAVTSSSTCSPHCNTTTEHVNKVLRVPDSPNQNLDNAWLTKDCQCSLQISGQNDHQTPLSMHGLVTQLEFCFGEVTHPLPVAHLKSALNDGQSQCWFYLLGQTRQFWNISDCFKEKCHLSEKKIKKIQAITKKTKKKGRRRRRIYTKFVHSCDIKWLFIQILLYTQVTMFSQLLY